MCGLPAEGGEVRLRLTLTLDLRRRDEPAAETVERAPDVDHKGAFSLERAEPQAVGFAANTGWRGDE